jgi:hypothetical protein
LDELILDTTYLLPALGIGIDLRDFGKKFPQVLEDYSVLYNPVNLVEGKWVVLRMGKRENMDVVGLLERYRVGLGAILRDGRLAQTSITDLRVEELADELLLKHRVNDYFDRMIYGTACAKEALLLTEDRELRELWKAGKAPRPSKVLAWKDIS